jgi:DNA-binding CsgD family transcriptional regulator
VIQAAVRVSRNLPEHRLSGLPLLRDLERRFRASRDPVERAHLADRLVPELVSNNGRRKALEVLAGIEARAIGDLDARGRFLALRAVVSATNDLSPSEDIAAAMALLPRLSGPAAAVVRHRAGVASANAGNALEAEGHSLAALALCDRYGLRWLAARTAATLYGVNYHVTADLRSARYYAELTTSYAAAAGDDALRRGFLVAQYDLAWVFAEWDRAQSLRDLLRREPSDDAYAMTIPWRVADAMMLGRSGDFSAMRGRLDSLLPFAGNPLDLAFITALRSLAMAGLGLKSEARTAAREALGASSLRGQDEVVHLRTRRRLAGVLAAWVSVIVGDAYHGLRALSVRAREPGPTGALATLLEAEARGLSGDVDNASLAPVLGYLVVAQRARQSIVSLEAATPYRLTVTELDVLRGVALGKSNAAIALERGVTRNAVERRLMSAYEKLGVNTRGEAVAKIAKLL